MDSLINLLVEPAMYLALGFLAAALMSLPLMGVAHRRAERLTRQRLNSQLPTSIKELEAEKDQLRAEHAVATQRLEAALNEVKEKSAAQQIEIGRNGGAITKLKSELDDKAQTIAAIEEREAALKQELRVLEQEHALQKVELEGALGDLHHRETELARLTAELATQSAIAEQQNVELARTRATVEALEADAADGRREREALNAQIARDHDDIAAASRQLADARGDLEAHRVAAEEDEDERGALSARLARLGEERDAARRQLAEERDRLEQLTQQHAETSALLEEARAAWQENEAELTRFAADFAKGVGIIERQDLALDRAHAELEALRLAAEEHERERAELEARIARSYDEPDATGEPLADQHGDLEQLAREHETTLARLAEARAVQRHYEAELADFAAEFAKGAEIIDQQDLELAQLRAEVEELRVAAQGHERERDALRARLARYGDETETASRRLADERGKAEELGRRVGELQAELIARQQAADTLAQLSAARISDQARRLAEHESETARLRAALDEARRAEAGLRYELTRIEERRMLESKASLAERAALEIQVARLQLDREQRQMEATHGSHRNGITHGHGAASEPPAPRLDPPVKRERRAREREERRSPHPSTN